MIVDTIETSLEDRGFLRHKLMLAARYTNTSDVNKLSTIATTLEQLDHWQVQMITLLNELGNRNAEKTD